MITPALLIVVGSPKLMDPPFNWMSPYTIFCLTKLLESV